MIPNLERAIRSGQRTPVWREHAANRVLDYHRPDIERLLHQRHPMLLVDRIEGLNLEIPSALGSRTIRDEDPVLAGHFPDRPIYPGSLQVETIGQMCLCLLHFMVRGRCQITSSDAPLDTRALRIHHAVFIQEIRPVMELEIQVRALGSDSLTATFAGQLVHRGAIMSLALMEVYVAGE